MVKWCFETGADLKYEINGLNQLLINAIDNSALDIIEWLSDKIDITQDSYFIQACYRGNLPIIKHLYSAGASLMAYGGRALEFACISENLETIDWLSSQANYSLKGTYLCIQYNVAEILISKGHILPQYKQLHKLHYDTFLEILSTKVPKDLAIKMLEEYYHE
jgi:hypothetical protein